MLSTLVADPLIICLQRLVSKVHFTFAFSLLSITRLCHISKISDVLLKAFYITVLCKGGLPWAKAYISHLHSNREKILSAKEKSFWLSRATTGEFPLLNCFPAFLYTRTRANMQTTVKLHCERGMDPLSWQIKPVWQQVITQIESVCER